MGDGYVDPNLEIIQQGRGLIGERITIYWDGDDKFYPGRIVDYVESEDIYKVLYENDDSGIVYDENLRESVWKLWRGNDEQYAIILENYKTETVENEFLDQQEIMDTKDIRKSSAKPTTYSAMVMDAVITLNDKLGSSLNAIRKYIATNFNMKRQQTASFNNLTLKAVNKCVASNELEKIKHSYRLTAAEREKRRILPDERLTRGSGTTRKNAPFTLDNHSTHNAVLAHNKALRQELHDFRDKRDKFLFKRLAILKPFLPEKDYFTKRIQDEENRLRFSGGIGFQRVFTSQPVKVEPAFNLQPNSHYSASLSINNPTQDHISTVVSTGETPEEDSQLLYSTLDGVPILEMPDIITASLHEHQVYRDKLVSSYVSEWYAYDIRRSDGTWKNNPTYLYKINKRGPHLIVVPLSVLSNWLTEIERFCPTFRAVRFHGPKSERDRIKEEELKDLLEFDIVVTTYEILVSEINYFRHKYVWTSITVDEGHRLKNEKSQFSEKIRCIPCITKLILTGTPLQNNLHELWAMIHFLAPDIFSSSEPFDEGFDLARGIIDSDVLRGARKLLSVFMLRRLKDMVSIRLPSRKEVTMLVPLTEQQTELYRHLLCGLDSSTIEVVMCEGNVNNNSNSGSSSKRTVTDGDGDEGKMETTDSNPECNSNEVKNPTNDELESESIPKSTVEQEQEQESSNSGKVERALSTNPSGDSDWRKLMNLLLQLRKICNHTYLLPNIAPDPYQVTEDLVNGSGKLMMLDRMLPILKADGHRVLLFSQFTSMLDILEDYCELRNYSYVRLDGETNRVKRRLDVRRFNSLNSNLFIFLISTRAGGLGLNLASADTVILYDSDWNPQVDLQAMERAHRIGQEKPVRVFRLICRGSVEERMVSRAEKKLFLNAMVAERDPDEELDEHHNGDNSTSAEIMEALGIGGTAMSKGELASLIRFGANAVFEGGDSTNANNQISDEELSKLLERQGRDKPYLEPAISTNTIQTVVASPQDTFEQAQQTLRERMEKLQEVDLRQLGDYIYKKKTLSAADRDRSTLRLELGPNDTLLDFKRQRKERITMVDGKGTGYGGSVPILTENLQRVSTNNTTSDDAEEIVRGGRGRLWHHRDICTLCGKSQNKAPFMKCAHCPFIIHWKCGESFALTSKGSGMFICPHHRCGICNRPTSAAGGLLFRCTGCLTAYCEDCLPQDQIDSLGRCRELEAFDYHSKQAYYIKCPSCCKIEGYTPLGILNDSHHQYNIDIIEENERIKKNNSTATSTEKTENENNGEEKKQDEEEQQEPDEEEEVEDEIEEEEIVSLPTHCMRIHWQEIFDPPPPPSKRRESRKSNGSTSSNRSTRKRTKKDATQEDEDDSEEDDLENDGCGEKKKRKRKKAEDFEELEDEQEELKEEELPTVPESCSLAEALSILLDHPAIHRLQSIAQRYESEVNAYEEFTWVSNKVESGRYRSTGLFVSDIKFTIEGKLLKKVSKALQTAGYGVKIWRNIKRCYYCLSKTS